MDGVRKRRLIGIWQELGHRGQFAQDVKGRRRRCILEQIRLGANGPDPPTRVSRLMTLKACLTTDAHCGPRGVTSRRLMMMTRNLKVTTNSETYRRCENEAIYLEVGKAAELTKEVVGE